MKFIRLHYKFSGSRDLCSNIKNGGGNGSCSGYSTQVVQYKLATEFRSFVLYLVFKCHFACLDGSWIHGLNAMWSGKLSDNHTAGVYAYYKTGKKEILIIGVYCKFNRRLNDFNGKGDQFSQTRYLPVTHYAGSAPVRSIHPVHKATHAVQEKH